MSESSVSSSERNSLVGLARGSVLSIAGAVCQQSALFVTTVVIGRSLGSDALGQYALTYALLTMIGLLAMCGFRAALTRFVATQLADGDPAAIRGTVRLCNTISVGSSIVISVILLLTAPQIAALFHNANMTDAVRWVSIALPGATIRDSALAATRGWRTQRPSVLIAWVFEPVLRLTVTVCVVGAGWGITAVYIALPIGTWSAAVASIFALRRRMDRVARVPARFEVRGLLSFSLVSWGNTMATTGLLWADTLILGHFRTAGDVGVYTISTRIVTLAIFVIAPIDAAFAPQFAHHFHLGQMAMVSRIYTSATGWILRLSLPAFVVLLVFPDELLELFGGSEFRAGAAVTVILAVGQLINATTGPCGTALTMAGRIGVNMIINVVALALNIGLNVFWIPRYGIVGAALAWSLSLGFVNTVKVIQLYFIARIHPFGRVTLKGLCAAVVAAFCALAVRYSVGPNLLACFLGILVILISYILTIFALGIEPEDRELVRRFRPARASD